MNILNPKDMFVFIVYPYDREADYREIIYVGITDFSANFKTLPEHIKYRNRIYRLECRDDVPGDEAGRVAAVYRYEVIKEVDTKITPVVVHGCR